MAATAILGRHLELLFRNPGPPTKSTSCPNIASIALLLSEIWSFESFVHLAQVKRLFPPLKLRFLGVLAPKHYFSSSRPQRALPWRKPCYISHQVSRSVQWSRRDGGVRTKAHIFSRKYIMYCNIMYLTNKVAYNNSTQSIFVNLFSFLSFCCVHLRYTN